MPKILKAQLNDAIEIYNREPGRVVGIDSYTLHPEAGAKQSWASYTLVSGSNQADRWWLVSRDEGDEVFLSATEQEFPKNFMQMTLDPTRSGAVVVEVLGDAQQAAENINGKRISSGYLRLATHNGLLFAHERFDGGGEYRFKAFSVPRRLITVAGKYQLG